MAARRTIVDLINLLIPEVREIFLQVIQGIVDEAIFADMVDAIERGDVAGAFQAAGFTPAALQPLIIAIDNVFAQGGATTVEGFPNPINTPTGRIVFRFDMRNTRAEEYLRDHSSALVTRLTDEARENVRVTMERGLIAGSNPRTTALDIVGRVDPVTKQRTGGIIGLTNNQENWVAGVRRKLIDLDKSYFNNELRDKRFDATVLKAIESGSPLSKDTVDKLVGAYKVKALKYRADVISQTETIQAINRSEYQAHMQAVDEGALNASDVTKHWDSAGDSRVRWTHKALDKKYRKKGIGLDEPFVSPSGAQMLFPGDTSLGASGDETIMCRCRQKYKVDWFGDL